MPVPEGDRHAKGIWMPGGGVERPTMELVGTNGREGTVGEEGGTGRREGGGPGSGRDLVHGVGTLSGGIWGVWWVVDRMYLERLLCT